MTLQRRGVLDPMTPKPPTEPPHPTPLRPRRIPIVSGALIGVCGLLVLVDTFTGDLATQIAGLYGPAVTQGGQWWRVVSSVLVHANIIHYAFNMSVVWTLGFVFESAVKPGRFLVISLITALGSSTLVLLLAPQTLTVGASGMILGWAGAMLPIANQQGRRMLATWLVQIAILSFLPMVSWQGHLGGFLFGLPCGLLLRQHGRYFQYGAPVLVFLAAIAVVAAARFGLAAH